MKYDNWQAYYFDKIKEFQSKYINRDEKGKAINTTLPRLEKRLGKVTQMLEHRCDKIQDNKLSKKVRNIYLSKGFPGVDDIRALFEMAGKDDREHLQSIKIYYKKEITISAHIYGLKAAYNAIDEDLSNVKELFISSKDDSKKERPIHGHAENEEWVSKKWNEIRKNKPSDRQADLALQDLYKEKFERIISTTQIQRYTNRA